MLSKLNMSTDVFHLFKGLFHFYETVKYLCKLAPPALKDCSFVLRQCFLPSQSGGHVLHPLVTSWVTVGSRVTVSRAYLPLPQERKQEMLAIAGLLCTQWEIMGAVQRGRDVPRVMFHTVWTGSSLSCHRSVSLPS